MAGWVLRGFTWAWLVDAAGAALFVRARVGVWLEVEGPGWVAGGVGLSGWGGEDFGGGENRAFRQDLVTVSVHKGYGCERLCEGLWRI